MRARTRLSSAAWSALLATSSAALLFSSCPAPPDPPAREACAEQHPDGELYWGDLHVHSAWSFDAFYEGVTTTPAEAYAFARGAPVTLPLDEGQPVELRLDRPLDFAAVTDHAEYFVETRACSDPASPLYDGEACAGFRAAGPGAVNTFGFQFSTEDPQRQEALCPGEQCSDTSSIWAEAVAATEAADDKTAACTFASLHGYEWSGTPGVSNLHRNVIFGTDLVPEQPTSYFDEPDPEDLWAALDVGCKRVDGCDVVVIPHNSNQSNGTLFVPRYGSDGDDASVATLRSELEVLMEVYQHKGSSECVDQAWQGVVGVVDEDCDFEQLRPTPLDDCGDETGGGGMIGTGCASRWDYLRGALNEGLIQQARLGVNPHRFGVIASTDTHLGTPGLVNEDVFYGHVGGSEDSHAKRLEDPGLRPRGIRTSPGGLVGVWAEARDRPSIFAGLKRREALGTSGPRIEVRFVAGEALGADPCAVERPPGVPMGGTLEDVADAAGPTFFVRARQDRIGLQRAQIVKGWLDDLGVPHVEVADVAGGPNDAGVDGSCEPVGEGAAELCGTWQDPGWDPSQSAWYYVRVLENPSCRWSTRDCEELPVELRPAACEQDLVQRLIQERAWTSPIWTG